MIKQIAIIAVLIFGSIAAAASIYNWYSGRNIPSSTTTYIQLPQIPVVTKIKRVMVAAPKQISTIDKPTVVKKLNLPAWVEADADDQIIATAQVAPYEGVTNAVAVMDTKTGESQIIAKQVPLPLFGFENKKELGIRVGYSTDQWEMRSTVYGRWQFVRIGNIHLGIYGEANSKGEGIGQLELNYKF